ncbi:MAG: LD-carboxypeptidase [Armatimonadetes bacterium]|nr:LD-carboxypeptidase [Armatimonadota bacterium]
MNNHTRRTFLRAAATTAVTGLLGSTLLPDTLRSQLPDGTIAPADSSAPRRTPRRRKKEEPPPLLKPAMLKTGDTIALVAPASGVSRGEVLEAAETLKRLGFVVKAGDHLNKEFGYLAAPDQQRADEFMRFIGDPEVKCIMAVRGGYGVMRILPLLDFQAIRANPKIVIGYSDITALVNPIFQKSGVIAFHGPVATSTFDRYTLNSFQRTLMATGAAGTFDESEEFSGITFSESRAATIVPGKAQGRLVGGNLSLVTALMGTPYQIDLRGNILFLEEIEEEPYRIDRMLMQLALSGSLGQCAGVALGRFTKCEARARGGEFQVSLSLEQVLRGILEPLKIPTVYGLPIGHIKSKLTVPVGGLATLDANARTLTLDEAVVG